MVPRRRAPGSRPWVAEPTGRAPQYWAAMNLPSEQSAAGIGAALKEARRRAGIDVKEAEERTKIRTRYLRALEDEDWEALPAPAYVRGFLRTYGEMLGIDGEALADEYRRLHESHEDAPAGLVAEPRERSRTPGERPSSRTPLILAVLAAIIILLVILSVIGGGNEGDSSGDGAARKLERDAGGGQEPLHPVGITLEPQQAVRVCLVGDGEALIDGQMLTAGAEESYDGFKRYRLDLADGGEIDVRSAGAKERIEADGRASYEADARGIRSIAYAGPECP